MYTLKEDFKNSCDKWFNFIIIIIIIIITIIIFFVYNKQKWTIATKGMKKALYSGQSMVHSNSESTAT